MIIAIAVAAILVVAGCAFFLLSGNEKRDTSVSVLAKVNAEGSGIFCKYPAVVDASGDLTMIEVGGVSIGVPAIDRNGNGNDDSPAHGWGGLSFMTPGAGSIQHEMLKTLAGKLGLDFVSGTGSDTSKLYWTATPPGQMSTFYTSAAGSGIDGGITWEPWYSSIVAQYSGEVAKKAYSIAMSGTIEAGHPCCMIVGNNAFVNDNEELVLRFLLAYMEAVDWVIDAKDKGKTSPEGQKLIEIARETSFTPDSNPTDDTIWAALTNTTYDYEITGLKAYVAELVERFEDSGAITETVSNPTAFANKLINEGPLNAAKAVTDVDDYKNPAKAVGTIRLGALANDLHQIAVRAAMMKGTIDTDQPNKSLFDIYGVNIDLKALQQNGPGVMNLFALNEIDIGVLGLPPTVIRVANGL